MCEEEKEGLILEMQKESFFFNYYRNLCGFRLIRKAEDRKKEIDKLKQK